MAKNFIQDIKPTSSSTTQPGKREPRNFSIAPNPARSLPKEVPFVPTSPKGSSKHGLWIVAILCIIGLIIAGSFLFESARVTIIPKTLPLAFDATDTFTATKDSTATDTLSYMVMSLSGDTSITLPSTQTQNVQNFAKGTATLYNKYSTSPFKIVKGTPIKASNGMMYKVDTQVLIPGYSKTSGTIVPGSIDVGITAASSGEASNIDVTDFTIPYFATRPQAGKIYAESKTAITGGLSGTLNTVATDTADAAYQSLKDKLRASLVSKARVQVPDGYLFYDGATVFQTDDTVAVPYSKTSDVPLGLHGTLTAYLIKQDSLVQNIVKKNVNDYAGETVTIPKISSLAFVLSPNSGQAPDTDTTISFSLNGNAQILWTINADDVKKSLVSKDKSSFSDIMSTAPGVEKADLVIQPFWKQSFPDDPKKIMIDVVYPTQ